MSTNQIGNLKTGHIGLNVSDLERSKEFYKTVFDFEIYNESKEEGKLFAFLGREDKIMVTLWQQSNKSYSTSNAGLHHLSFEVESLEKLLNAENKLKEMGARFQYEGVVSHREGSQSGGIFFEDPDGIRLEIYAPRGADEFHAPNENATSCGFF